MAISTKAYALFDFAFNYGKVAFACFSVDVKRLFFWVYMVKVEGQGVKKIALK